jgi:hypothetical protein
MAQAQLHVGPTRPRTPDFGAKQVPVAAGEMRG